MTLIELVVALAVAGAVLVVGYGAFASIADRRMRSQEVIDEVIRAASVREQLRSWLAGASLRVEEAGLEFRGMDGVHGDGPDDSLTFLTNARTPLGVGLSIVHLAINRDEAAPERGLVAEFREWRGNRVARLELEPRAAGLDLRYLTALRGERQWLTGWISNTVLPAGVELQLTATNGDSLPPLLARPLLVPLQNGR